MVKGVDNGVMSCIAKSGKPKSRWDTDTEAIENAKYINENKLQNEDYKLVAYKCPHCHHYHLTSKSKRKRHGKI